jgi:ABC-2 type transport system ATP-binding protein
MEEAEYCNRLALIFRGKMVALGSPSELKKNYMQGELLVVELTVDSDELGPAVAALQSNPEVSDAAVFGDSLHLVVEDATKAAPHIREFLSARGIAVSRVEKIRPTLEDVFVSLTTAHRASEGKI